MSVAVGLSFTGCGNSSNGGSTGPNFEQVPLIGDGYEAIVCESLVDNINVTFLLRKSGNEFSISFRPVGSGESDIFSGSWSAEQSPTSYQIKLFNISPDPSCNCTLKYNALTLTIPKDKLQDYRKGKYVTGATLYVDFEHTTKASCKLPSNTGAIQGEVYADIKQYESMPR